MIEHQSTGHTQVGHEIKWHSCQGPLRGQESADTPIGNESYPIWHTQLVTTITKTKKQKKKRLRLTKTKLKDMLKYEQVEETIKRVNKMKEKSPNL